MYDWPTPRLTLFFVTALSLVVLTAPGRVAGGGSAKCESLLESLLEEVKKDAEVNDVLDVDGLPHAVVPVPQAVYGSRLCSIGCDSPLTTSGGRLRTRGPPLTTFLSTL
jgi:hypothetical protein